MASNSSRYVVLSFKIDSSMHLYCYFEKKKNMAVQVVTIRSSLFTLWCLRSGVKSTATLIRVLYTVFETRSFSSIRYAVEFLT